MLRYQDASGRENSTIFEETPGLIDPPAYWNGPQPWIDKYIDDVNAGEHHYTKNGISIFSAMKGKRLLRAAASEAAFETVNTNAERIGMMVNPAKMQLLCIALSNNYDTTSYIELRSGQRIQSGNEMVLLGLKFNDRPAVAAHIDLIRSKFNCRSWILRHLKMAGVPDATIANLYAAIIRPVVEYAVPVYHWLLNKSQSDDVEKLQRRAMKILFGPKTSYKEALKLASLPNLEERTEEIVKKFTLKTAAQTNFERWFPKHHETDHNTHRRKKFLEEHAHTDCLYRSPLFSMRRLLNE